MLCGLVGEYIKEAYFSFFEERTFFAQNPFGLKLTFDQKLPCRKLFAHVLGGCFLMVTDDRNLRVNNYLLIFEVVSP